MAELTQFKYAPKQVADFFEQTKGVPEWAQRQMFDYQFKPASEGELTQAINAFKAIRKEERDPAYQKQQLQNALEFQKEQMRQAAPYKMLFELPNQIMQAFTVPGQIRLAGAQASAENVMEGLRSAAAISAVPMTPYQRPNIQYF